MDNRPPPSCPHFCHRSSRRQCPLGSRPPPRPFKAARPPPRGAQEGSCPPSSPVTAHPCSSPQIPEQGGRPAEPPLPAHSCTGGARHLPEALDGSGSGKGPRAHQLVLPLYRAAAAHRCWVSTSPALGKAFAENRRKSRRVPDFPASANASPPCSLTCVSLLSTWVHGFLPVTPRAHNSEKRTANHFEPLQRSVVSHPTTYRQLNGHHLKPYFCG